MTFSFVVTSKINEINNLIQDFCFQHKPDISVQIDIEGFKKFQQKINLPPVGTELTTPTIR